MKVAVLASRSGTNLQALIDELHNSDESPVEIVLVLSDRRAAYALERARQAGIPTAVVRPRDFDTRELFDRAVAEQIEQSGAELIFLAGFLRIFQPPFIHRFKRRIINTHNAILPSFRGIDAVRDALEYGVKVTGVTVHFVAEEVDAGPVIAQLPVVIEPNDDIDSLTAKVRAVENRLCVEVVRAFADGRVALDGRRVTVARAD